MEAEEEREGEREEESFSRGARRQFQNFPSRRERNLLRAVKIIGKVADHFRHGVKFSFSKISLGISRKV